VIVALAVALLAAPAPPARMLWNWYGNAMTASLPPDVGVAHIVASISLHKVEDARPMLRRDPVRFPPGAYRMAVVRVEHYEAAFTGKQRAQTAQMIAEAVELTRSRAVQIDFDAPQRAWPFYRSLISDVRRRIGPGVFLSMTALASWCTANSWLRGVEADEIVPMFFQMQFRGVGIKEELRDGKLPALERCRASAGVALDEPVPGLRAQRIYMFTSYNGWSEGDVREALTRYKK